MTVRMRWAIVGENSSLRPLTRIRTRSSSELVNFFHFRMSPWNIASFSFLGSTTEVL